MGQKKVVIAAGGAGGHLFPAQALAEEIRKKGIDVFFIGAGLDTNRYFDRERYPYASILSATVFCRNILKLIRAVFSLCQGVFHSLKLLKREKPDLVVGFGSFHSFPVLCAAKLQKKQIALFESNAYPGKVNRLFAPHALYTAVVFSQAGSHLKGKVEEVAMPLRAVEEQKGIDPYAYFGLESSLPILLLFGGSQGASKMNELFLETAQLLRGNGIAFQVIHLAGNGSVIEEIQKKYLSMGVKACVKPFEKEMPFAYQIAHLAICRSGAATVCELMGFSLPSILIPFPYASDDHQTKNALFLQNEVGGGICLPQAGLTKEILASEITSFLEPSQRRFSQMKKELDTYKKERLIRHLSDLIHETLTAEPL